MAFADPDDVQARCLATLSSTDQDRAAVLLDDAARKIVAYTRRTFTRATSSVTLRAMGGTVIIPNRPVLAITDVKLVDFLGNQFTVPAFGFDQIDRIDLSYYGLVLNLPESLSFNSEWSGTVIVTYDHGYDPIPDDIVSVNADMVARIFNSVGGGMVGVGGVTTGPYSVTASRTTTTGVVTITDDDRLILNQYRTPARAVELR